MAVWKKVTTHHRETLINLDNVLLDDAGRQRHAYPLRWRRNVQPEGMPIASPKRRTHDYSEGAGDAAHRIVARMPALTGRAFSAGPAQRQRLPLQ